MKFGKRPGWQSIIYSYPTLFIVLVVVVLLAQSAYERYTTEREMYERRVTSEATYNALEARKASLIESVTYMEGERGIEEELRTNFDVAKPGEQVIVLTGETEEETPTSTPEEIDSSWWQFWR